MYNATDMFYVSLSRYNQITNDCCICYSVYCLNKRWIYLSTCACINYHEKVIIVKQKLKYSMRIILRY